MKIRSPLPAPALQKDQPKKQPRDRRRESRYLNTKVEIVERFKQFRNQRLTLTLQVEGSNLELSCQVLDVLDNAIYLENILPREALVDFRKKPRFTLSIRDEGNYAFVEGLTVTALHEERGLPYFEIPIPKQMLYQQRRKATRYSIPLRVASRGAQITFFRHMDMVGEIIDISIGGCRANFTGPLLEPIAVDEVVDNCAIALPPFLEIHSRGVVRHCHKNKQGVTTCGIELTDMHVTDRRRLEQFIQTLAKQT
ncbi:MAG: hypothetical protein GKR90_06100 [Pseudomonadales bacterium]|nr:hypothetical protein [Pseudomonadales bacterium]